MGFGGAFISLFLSKAMAKWSTGARHHRVRATRPNSGWYRPSNACRNAPASPCPKSPSTTARPNAFATGASKEQLLVAVSTGLLQSMSKEEVEAVLAHEVAHVANGDMVTLTLIQGVVNTFVVFLSRVVGYLVDSFLRRNDESSSGPGIGYMVTA